MGQRRQGGIALGRRGAALSGARSAAASLSSSRAPRCATMSSAAETMARRAGAHDDGRRRELTATATPSPPVA